MRVSLEWLNEYVDVSGLCPEEIAEALTRSGLEVEEIETQGPRFSGVVVAQVEKIEQHPNADRLRLVTVNLGENLGTTRVVCGAPNVRESIRIAFAQDGATVLSRKDGSTFQLSKTAIRGIESAGMVCSIDELGLEGQFEKSEDGIWPLDNVSALSNATLGQDLKEALGLEADTILHVAPPANRGDLMSMRGIAREVAALFNRELKPAAVAANLDGISAGSVNVALSDNSVCGYYAGAALESIKIAPSPGWMVSRLQAAGVRVINNVVDITNYVMLETGQPLHSFDANKLAKLAGANAEVGVRRAKSGEKLTALDDVERPLTEESIIISLNDAPVALAGLMGGESTEVDDQSTALFLEAAFFPGAMVRKSAKSVGLRSEASARFERGTDISQVRAALARAVSLLQELAGAKLTGLSTSAKTAPAEPKVVLSLSLARVEQILGVAVDANTCSRILAQLGFDVTPSVTETGVETGNDTVLQVSIPSYRQQDITRQIDLIEEIARIYGYDQVPYTLPQNTGTAEKTPRARFLARLNAVMLSHGLSEVMTASLIGPKLLERAGFAQAPLFTSDAPKGKSEASAENPYADYASVLNSHSVDHTLMRQSLMPGLLEVAQHNQAQGIEDVWVYELGRTYFRRGKASPRHAGVVERLRLSGLLMGNAQSGQWQKSAQGDVAFYDVKGILESLFADLHLTDRLVFSASSQCDELHPGKTATIALKPDPADAKAKADIPIGFIGALHPARQASLKLRKPVFVFELDVEAILKAVSARIDSTRFVHLPTFPSVERDMALLAPTTLTHADIMAVLNKQDEPLLRDIALFDEYRSEQLGADKRSLAYRLTFRSDEVTLTEKDIDQRLSRLKESLTAALPVQLR